MRWNLLLAIVGSVVATACDQATPQAKPLAPPPAVAVDHVVQSERRVDAVLEASTGIRFKLEGDLPDGLPCIGALLTASDQIRHLQHQDQKALAEQVVAAGRAAYRFNWGFFHARRGGPSSSLPAALNMERAELAAALAFVTKQPRMCANDIVLLGQGLGAIVAWQQFRERQDLRALVVYDPPCMDGMFASRFPQLLDETRPVLVLAHRKAGACPGEQLDGALQHAPASLRRIDYPSTSQALLALKSWLTQLSPAASPATPP
jgi:hypothetical protein